MKVTWKWLEEYVDLSGLTIEDVEGRLASAGLHVEEVYRPYEVITHVVVGFVESCEKHPDADRLQICSVSIGAKKVQIVTAAPNIRAQIFVPVALDGAHLANGLDIKTTKLRGALSEGMFCSLEELGLEEKSPGVFIMPEYLKPEAGKPIYPYLGLDDTMIDFEITANRSDLLSVMGIAREMALVLQRSFQKPVFSLRPSPRVVTDKVSVSLNADDACYRYTARYIENVVCKPSPHYVQTRLILTGLRPKNAVVDSTNYIMAETGLPLHAFDATVIANGEIHIRKARNNEHFVTLGDHELTLDTDALMIADATKALALAGIIGGKDSEIRETTSQVILEAALFEPVGVRKTTKKTGITTDSSYRFERGLDFDTVAYASERAAWFLQEYADGTVFDGMVDASKSYDPSRRITVRWKRITDIIGMTLDTDTVSTLYTRLGFRIIERNNDAATIAVPSARYWDIIREIDVIEEIARLYGYDNIPASMPSLLVSTKKRDKNAAFRATFNERLHALGMFEAYVFPFVNERQRDALHINADALYTLKNPLNKDMEFLSPDAIMPLMSSAEINLKRGSMNVRLYEWGKEYTLSGGERDTMAFILTGSEPQHVYSPARELTYADCKAIVDVFTELIPGTMRSCTRTVFEENTGFELVDGNDILMQWGLVRKSITEMYDISTEVWAGCVYCAPSIARFSAHRAFRPFSVFPPVYYDLAFVVDRSVQSAEIIQCVKDAAGVLLEATELFDIYEGKQIADDKKSMTFSLVFRASDRTLTEAEISRSVHAVKEAVEKKFHAVLR